MFYTIRELFTQFFAYRKQIGHLAVTDLRKSTRGSALGGLWLFIKPAMYIFCFWFALYLGIKGAHAEGLSGGQYMLWLSAGIIPWFFLQKMLTRGSDLFHVYPYLVNKLRFPIVLIPVFCELSEMILHLMLLACLIVGYFIGGGALDIYAVQLPLLVIIMYAFSLGWALLASSLSAFSKDVKNLANALSTPIFWLSGILFDIYSGSLAELPIIQTVALFNPVTFLATCYRKVFTVSGPDTVKTWIWSDPVFFGCGIGVILVTIIAGFIVFSKVHKDIPDVI